MGKILKVLTSLNKKVSTVKLIEMINSVDLDNSKDLTIYEVIIYILKKI